MTFESGLNWIVTFFAGVVTSWIQDKLHLDIPQRVVTIGLSALVAILAVVVQFVWKVPLFGDLNSVDDLLRILGAFLMALGGSQTAYAIGKKYERQIE